MLTRPPRPRAAEPARDAGGPPAAGAPSGAPGRRARALVGVALGAVLALALAVRLWAIDHGLPYVYNLDEGTHFVQLAVRYFSDGYNPHYFQNPPAFSYLLHAVYALFYGVSPFGDGRELRDMLVKDPAELYVVGRVVAAVMGVAAAGALFLLGRRLFGAATGLVAATLLAFTFLPVHYSHLALNDVPTLLPLVVGMIGAVLVYQRGDWPSYLLAGGALGLATAFKYTAAALAVPIAVAAALRIWAERDRLRPEGLRLLAAGAFSLLVFVVANPYAVIEPREFGYYVRRQQRYSGEIGKLGLDDVSGWRYYAWTLTWGYGWVACALSAVGAFLAVRRDWRRALIVVSFVVAYWLVMGVQMRFYARWFLPVYPFLAVLAGYAVVRLAAQAPPRWRVAAGAALVAAALVQPAITVVHNNRALSRTDTRELARTWLVENLPRTERLVLEPISSPGFARKREFRRARELWTTFRPSRGRVEEYVAGLRPGLIDKYAAQGFCVVVVGSNQRQRAYKEADEVPRAVAYYERLDRDAERVAVFDPMKPGRPLPEFNFDLSYNAYDLDQERPGPLVEVFRLSEGVCGQRAVLRGEAGSRGALPPLAPRQRS